MFLAALLSGNNATGGDGNINLQNTTTNLGTWSLAAGLNLVAFVLQASSINVDYGEAAIMTWTNAVASHTWYRWFWPSRAYPPAAMGQYWVRFHVVSGATGGGFYMDTWNDVYSYTSAEWLDSQLGAGVHSIVLRCEIASDAAGSNILSTSTHTINVTVTA